MMWEGGISKEKYPQVRPAAHEAYQLLERAAMDLLPDAHPGRQQALVATAWSVVHGYATLTLERELEVAAPGEATRTCCGRSLHLLLDQFSRLTTSLHAERTRENTWFVVSGRLALRLLRLRNETQIRLRGLPAVGILLLGFFVGNRG